MSASNVRRQKVNNRILKGKNEKKTLVPIYRDIKYEADQIMRENHRRGAFEQVSQMMEF